MPAVDSVGAADQREVSAALTTSQPVEGLRAGGRCEGMGMAQPGEIY